MNYIVFDLEFNQGYNDRAGNYDRINPKCPFEIIQIGAVKLDNDRCQIDTFNRIIKPALYSTLHPFVKNITGITEKQLKSGSPFNEVYDAFLSFIGKDPCVFVSWGGSDVSELFRNIEFHQLPTAEVPKEYINIQQFASVFLESPKGSTIGLRTAVEILEIPTNHSFHDAYHDAYYTSEIFRRIYTPELKVLKYVKSPRRKPAETKKTSLDSRKLFNQFQKMYDRKLTKLEKDMILLAYHMGKSRQFQREDDKK